jgi:hypothetical protein
LTFLDPVRATLNTTPHSEANISLLVSQVVADFIKWYVLDSPQAGHKANK